MNKDLLNILANSNKDIDNQQLMDYLSGKLSGEDLHELERSMAGDEFLNDAVEGLQKVREGTAVTTTNFVAEVQAKPVGPPVK